MRASGSGAYIRQSCSNPVATASGCNAGASRRLISASGRLHTRPIVRISTTIALIASSPTGERSNRCPIVDSFVPSSANSFSPVDVNQRIVEAEAQIRWGSAGDPAYQLFAN
jgi:hypothetical protein